MPVLSQLVDATLEANRLTHSEGGPHRGPFRSARALALVFGAMWDAASRVQGGAGRLPIDPGAAPQGADPTGAAAAAGLEMLEALYRGGATPRLNAALDLVRAAVRPQLRPEDLAFGSAVSGAVAAWRLPDAALYGASATPVAGPDYTHAADPYDPGATNQGEQWGAAAPFQVPLQPLADPFAVGSASLIAEYKEVRTYGHEDPRDRTADRTIAGTFWGYDGAKEVGTPPRLYVQVLRKAMAQFGLSELELLELLAAASLAMADAGVQAWYYKYTINYWRPVVGLRRQVEADWRPLGRPDTNGLRRTVTPDFPAYPSGHATFGAAAFQVARRFVKFRKLREFDPMTEADTIAFEFTSDEFDGVNLDPVTRLPRTPTVRRFPGLWAAVVENSESRIWLGVHWRMDGISKVGPEHGTAATPAELGTVGGVRLGFDIANAIATGWGW